MSLVRNVIIVFGLTEAQKENRWYGETHSGTRARGVLYSN